jgi:hypothetical protein
VVSSSSEEIIVPPTPGSDFKEHFRDECPVASIPKIGSNPKLPDPFTAFDGSKVTTKAQWKCRREEISALLEEVELGEKPRNPEKVEGSYSGGSLKVTVTDKGKTISFSVKISGAGTKDNPKPAIIGFSGGSLDYSGLNIATISFNPDDVAPEKTRGTGRFYDIYGSNHSAGAMIAWAWGVSRVIDALEKTPEAGIDVHHLGVTGCSRLGKGAAVAGPSTHESRSSFRRNPAPAALPTGVAPPRTAKPSRSATPVRKPPGSAPRSVTTVTESTTCPQTTIT